MWSGVEVGDPIGETWTNLPGYGNSWNDVLEFTLSVPYPDQSSLVSVTADLTHDLVDDATQVAFVDDGLVEKEKIGGSNFFWSFPAKKDRINQLRVNALPVRDPATNDLVGLVTRQILDRALSHGMAERPVRCPDRNTATDPGRRAWPPTDRTRNPQLDSPDVPR